MANKKPLTGIGAIKAIKEPAKNQTVIAGKDAAEKGLAQTKAVKRKPLALRLSQKDQDSMKDMARMLQDFGLPYSEANAVRLALRYFKASEATISKAMISEIAEEVKSEDGRRLK